LGGEELILSRIDKQCKRRRRMGAARLIADHSGVDRAAPASCFVASRGNFSPVSGKKGSIGEFFDFSCVAFSASGDLTGDPSETTGEGR
jgi:hypothetical protein